MFSKSALLGLATAWLAIKLAYILSPYNPLHEARCWFIYVGYSFLFPFGSELLNSAHKQCVDAIIHEFPQNSDWDLRESVVYLNSKNMSEFFANTKNPLDRVIIIKNFSSDLDLELNRFSDVHYFRSKLTNARNYPFHHVNGTTALMTMDEALGSMLNGTQVYMRFCRTFTADEKYIDNVIDEAAKEFIRQGGPIIETSLSDSVKVTFLTLGDKIHTKIHNAMSPSYLWQVTGSKNWKIYDPRHAIYLQPFAGGKFIIASGSHYDTNFPKGPKYIEVTTNPGDILYFPSFWLHEVENVGEGFNLGFGLRPSFRALKQMFFTAFVPFYESPPGTTGLALAHIGQSLVTIQRGFKNKLKTAGTINGGFSTSDLL